MILSAAVAELDADSRSVELHWELYQVTGDSTHLDAAKQLLDESLSKVPETFHEAMLTNLVNREIMAAWRERTGERERDVSDDDDDPPRSESITKVGPL